MPDTPLGTVIAIRMEKDGETIRKMTKDQKRIRQEWAAFRASEGEGKDVEESMRQLEQMLAGMFG